MVLQRLLTLFSCLFVLGGGLSANTIFVPDDYSTIQNAIDAAIELDTVLVRSGVYTETIDLQGKGILLSGAGDRDSTIIVGKILIVSGEPEHCIVDKLSITVNSDDPVSPAIRVSSNGNPSIQNVRISSFHYSIRVANSTISVIGCKFENNTLFGGGSLIAALASTINFSNNVVTNNATNTALIYVWTGPTQVNLFNNYFSNNESVYSGSGFFMIDRTNDAACTVNSESNIFMSNDIYSCYGDVEVNEGCNISYGNSWDDRQELCTVGTNICSNPEICVDDTAPPVLNSSSPCLPENRPPDSCGIIGPLAVGCNRPVPSLSDPYPAPDIVWPEVYGMVGATLFCETGIEAAGLAVRIDSNNDGDYLDGGAEDWTPVTGYSDAPEIQVRAPVRFPRSGVYHWEVKGRDVVSGWWVYSGSEGRQGIADDWTVTINRLPRTWQLPGEVADLFVARDSLQDGDTLRLAPGTWAGGVDFGPWNVAIVGDGAPEEVIIQAPVGELNILHFRTSPVPGSCWIENLTLQGGNGDVVAATTLFARNCRFPEGGIWGSLLDARECVSTGHLFGSVGMTLYECEHSGGVDWSREIPTSREDVQPGVAWVARCVFRNNWIGGMGGEGAGLLLPTGCDGLVANNVFRDNSIDGWNENGSPPRAYGAGLYATGNVDAVGNLFVDNGVVVGGDLGFAGGAAARTSGAFIGNTVVDCWAQGLTWPDASLSIVSASEIRDNIFAGNIGNGNTCTASGCNLYWQNLDSYGTQPWATGNCGVDEGGEVWEDPLFVDAANGDYRLLPASPAWPLNHLDTAPGCGLLGAFGRSWPVAILDIELRYNPLTARLSLRCEQVGLPVHIYAATDADGSFSELTTFTPTDYETLVEIPLGTYMPATRFFRATQELPDMSLAGGWCWSLPAGSHPLPEPPLVTELDRLQRAGLPWKPQIR